ncbi:ribonuclease H-like domain-containing protein [Tanacetum coccineum]
MDLETAQITTTVKLPTLKQGEYDLWRLRIEQYFQIQDYALWDVIENGNSFKPAAKTITNAYGTSTTLILGPVTTEEKVQKKNNMKARSMLLMALPNEHLMTFNQYKDAKTFAPSTESVDSIFNRLQKISYMADDEVPTNMARIAFSDSEVHNDKTCSKTYLKSFETLKTQLDDLRIEFNNSEFNLPNYKRRLAYVEEQLVFYKKNEVIFCEQLVVLKRDISYKDSEISMLKSELEKLKQEKERLFLPPNLDLSNSGLEEFQQPEFKGYGPKTSKNVSEDTSNDVRESSDAPLVEELVSNDKKKTVFPTVAKIKFVRPKQQEKPVRKPVKYAEMYRSQGLRGNQRNWNNQKPQQQGSNFVMYNKACFVCGSFDHVQANCNYHQRERVVSGNNYSRVNYNYYAKKAHPSAHRNITPRAVLIKTGLRPLNTARPVNTAHPKTTVYSARPMLYDEEPHAHIRHFESITNNQRYPDVPNTTIKLLLFPFSLDGVAKTWLDKEPPNSILTWDDDLVSKFINFFFSHIKTTNLRNEITNFRQIAQESFSEAWERFKELLRKCPHHGFSLMHQLDTFYNSLSYNDQDSLNSAAEHFLYKSPNEGLLIIENKAKVRCSRNAVMRVSTNAPPSSNSSSNFEFQQMAC